MNVTVRGLRYIRSSYVNQPQQLSRRLVHFRQKPAKVPCQYGRATKLVANSSSLTPALSAITKRNYASDPLAVRPEGDTSKTANASPNANASVDGQTDKDQVPAYDLSFTCKKCLSRSTHRVSKQGFYKGTVLITCPGCKNRHLISDHLKIFSDKPVTIEDLMRDKGQLVKRGNLNSDGDVEFWDNESTGTGEIKDKAID